MATCQSCETEIPDGLRVCPRCRALQPTPKERQHINRMMVVGLALSLLLIVAALLLNATTLHL